MKSRSFLAHGLIFFKWLHNDEEMDAAFCHVCAKAEDNGRFPGSGWSLRDAAFLDKVSPIGKMLLCLSQRTKYLIAISLRKLLKQ